MDKLQSGERDLVLESDMKTLKLIISALVGATCGAAMMYFLMPLISRVFVGPIQGEDQMTQNFLIFLVGAPLLAIIGAICGWLAGRRLFN